MDDKPACHSETNLPALKALSRFLLSHLYTSPCCRGGSLVCGTVVGAFSAGGALSVQLLTKAGQGPLALSASTGSCRWDCWRSWPGFTTSPLAGGSREGRLVQFCICERGRSLFVLPHQPSLPLSMHQLIKLPYGCEKKAGASLSSSNCPFSIHKICTKGNVTSDHLK